MRIRFLTVVCLILCLTGSTAFASNPMFPGADVLIDVGHGGIDGGATHGNLLEKDLNLAIAKKTQKVLAKKGFRVVLNRNKDYALSEDNRHSSATRHKRDLAQRSGLANMLKPKVMISLHVNWSSIPKKRGPLVIYQNRSESIMFANLLQRSFNKLYETAEIPAYGKSYYVLNHTVYPAVILEMGYLSNSMDRNLLTNSRHQTHIAEAVSQALIQYFTMLNPIEKNRQD